MKKIQMMIPHPQQYGSEAVPCVFRRLAVLIALAFSSQPVHATLLYSEDFTTTDNTSVSTFGWSAFANDATVLSLSVADPLYVASADRIAIGSSGANANGAYAMITDSPSINPAGYQNDLTISFTQTINDRDTADPVLGWRVLLEVGSEWHASTLLDINGFGAINAVVADPVWRSWTTAESNLTDGFVFGSSDFTAAGALPAGTISRVGLLAVDGSTTASGGDSLTLYDFQINATAIPEPSSAAMMILGLTTGYLCWRRRR